MVVDIASCVDDEIKNSVIVLFQLSSEVEEAKGVCVCVWGGGGGGGGGGGERE